MRQKAASGDSTAMTSAAEPNSTESVEATISLAMKPATSAVAKRQSPNPSGEKSGATKVEIAARIESCWSSTSASEGLKLWRNQTTTAATKTTVKARVRKSLLFSHTRRRTDLALGMR